MCFPNILVKSKWISEFRRTNPQELKCWSTFCVNYFLRYYLMMQHQPIVKRVNGTHDWAHRPYQLLSAPITAACTNTGGKMKGSLSRAADRCPFVPRHSLSQVTSFMQLKCYVPGIPGAYATRKCTYLARSQCANIVRSKRLIHLSNRFFKFYSGHSRFKITNFVRPEHAHRHTWLQSFRLSPYHWTS